jgi:hypothetical protein
MANLVSIPLFADQMVSLGAETSINVQKRVVMMLLSCVLLLFILLFLVRDYCSVVLGNAREHLQDFGVLIHGKIVVFRAQMKAFWPEGAIRNQKVVPFLLWGRQRSVLVAVVVGRGVGGPFTHGDSVEFLVCLCVYDFQVRVCWFVALLLVDFMRSMNILYVVSNQNTIFFGRQHDHC